ncbi:TPA: elongation factor 4 [Candidatus Dependentiae bacterium]|nr:MAG: Membrane GTPase LepA [candidate division TM6 bacterium GW2011_GWE2_31_21]KKP53743.1 MAG: Membrane GTPase LepA [candidate division TM6 bacterium GW2011_GWF2_33_332]HBS48503.1 elongation factor 4 [Candidatus Dependentiae bacterium]HBZ73118.1 elongation factor 4 [Candidatus Dependentiae bacterium]
MDIKDINLKEFKPDQIRNFSIIAHIDHGKSTLADRLLEITGTISNRQKQEQFLDKLQVERERGITVKAQTASLFYEHKGIKYLLNLIDTPGHVDFSYEVSRSLYACQGALLLVDAAQGIQAQTMANFFLAFDQDLTIIPVINKVDMTNADPKRVAKQMEKAFDVHEEELILTSAKTGFGMDKLLPAIIERIAPPKGDENKTLKALIFDSWFDEYRGVVCLIEVIDGSLEKGDFIVSANTDQEYEVLDIGLMYPELTPTGALYTGQVGFLIAGMKTVKEARVGDTIYLKKHPVKPLPGFKPAKPMVYAGLYPIEASDYENLRDAIEKLTLNDASVHVEKESSVALGIGFRCGFLGLLHMDVFKQRLEQEYNILIITTSPTVPYRIRLTSEEEMVIDNPANFPETTKIDEIYEPVVDATIITPKEYLGSLLQLCEERRGIQKDMTYLDEDRVILKYVLPLNEIITDFYDKLKSYSAGYASFDYDNLTYQPAELVKMNIMLNGKPVDALSVIVHEEKAYRLGKELVEKLRQVIPRHMFEVAIQAAIGAKIIARETVTAMRKNVIAKCYGGDITRKRKLLEKQKEGKKKMKQVGNVELPQEAFLVVLKK